MAERELTDKQKLFLDALFDEKIQGDVRAAMHIAGYSPNTPSSHVLDALHDDIVERSKKVLAGHAAKATMKAVKLLDDPTELGGDKLLAVAKEIWDRSGIVKKDKLEVSAEGGGAILILPPKQTD